MKRKLFLFILIIFFTTSFMSFVGCDNIDQKENVKKEYDLRERCGKYCEEYFYKKYGNGIVNTATGQENWSYTSHYNKKINKCFMLTTTSIFRKNVINVSIQKELFDIHEQKTYGIFMVNEEDKIVMCSVSGKECKTIPEWDSLVKPYMEE